MTTIRSLYAAFLVACAVFLSSARLCAQAYSQPTNQLLAIGDTNIVTAYAVSRLWELHVTVWGTGTNGTQVIAGWVDDRNLQFGSFETVAAYYNSRLQFALNQAMTNRNPKIDLSQPCAVLASYNNNVYLGATWGYYWGYSPSFNYPTNSQGGYTTPPLTKFPLTSPGMITYVVPGIKWAICETFYRTNGTRVALWDSRTNSDWNTEINGSYDPNGGVTTNYDWFTLRTTFACDQLTYSNKIEIVTTNGYFVLDPHGFIRPETPVVLKPPYETNGQFVVDYSGGDPGRTLTLLESPDLSHWVQSAVSTNGYSQLSIKRQSVVPNVDRSFYRVLLGY